MIGTENWMVGDLIDEETLQWNELMVSELFTPFEKDLIMQIPISFRRMRDKLTWTHGKRRNYEVKSGYKVALAQLPVNNGGTSTSNTHGSQQKTIWPIIWKARVLPKVRSFIWKVVRGILPTKSALSKKIQGLDTKCVFCGLYEETDMHLFKDCNVVACYWVISPLGIRPREQRVQNIFAWIDEICHTLDNDQICLFFSTLWAIWIERYRLVFDGGTFDPKNTVNGAIKLMEEYFMHHPDKNQKKKRPQTCWKLPPSGRLKANVDGSYDPESDIGGVGVVVRDEHGSVVVTKAFHMSQGRSALHLEAMAIRSALLLACEHNWATLDVESNCALAVSAFHQEGEDLTEVGQIIEDCKTLSTLIPSCSVMHIYREANGVANRLARVACMSMIDSIWLNEAPSILNDVLVENGCNHSRGLGYTSSPVYASIANLINNNNRSGTSNRVYSPP